MNAKQRKKYTYDRKLHTDARIRAEQEALLIKVVIHNAKLSKEVESTINNYIKYYPEKSTEAHFWIKDKGELHVVNPRGVTRKERDKDLVEELSNIFSREIELQISHYKNDSAKSSRRFEEFAFAMVTDVFKRLNKSDIIRKGHLSIILGPHRALSEKGVYEDKNDYLNYKILKDNIIFFDYIFADQAKNILSKVYSSVNAYFKNLNVNVFHYGKVGILNSKLKIGYICLPIAALDENKVLNGDHRAYPIHNQLIYNTKLKLPNSYKGTTINMTSVLKQNRENLKKSLKAGGDFLEMEWSVMASLDHGYHSNYPNLGNINYFFAGIASDKPLENQTLANTKYPLDQEKKVAKAFLHLAHNL